MMHDEKYWEAREDARTLRDYQRVKNDPERLARAKQVIAEDLQGQLQALGLKNAQVDAMAKTSMKNRNPATLQRLSVQRP